MEDYAYSQVVFDDMLGSRQAKDIDQFFTRSRHSNINVYYISQSWYALPKNTIRNNASIIYLFQQTKKDVQSLYNDIAGFDMPREEFYDLCKQSWSVKYNYIKIDRSKDKDERYSIHNTNSDTYKRCIIETDPF